MSNALYNLQFRGKIKKILAHEQYNSTVKIKGTTLPAVNWSQTAIKGVVILVLMRVTHFLRTRKNINHDISTSTCILATMEGKNDFFQTLSS